MQAINLIKNQTKLLVTSVKQVFTTIKHDIHPYSRLLTKTCTNTLFFRLSSSILKNLTFTSQNEDKKKTLINNEKRYFSCKEKAHIVYHCFIKEKIAAITELMSKTNNS